MLNARFVHDHPSFSTTESTRFGPTDFILLEGKCYIKQMPKPHQPRSNSQLINHSEQGPPKGCVSHSLDIQACFVQGIIWGSGHNFSVSVFWMFKLNIELPAQSPPENLGVQMISVFIPNGWKKFLAGLQNLLRHV